MADEVLRAGQEILDLRLLRLEQERDDHELRLRLVEKQNTEMNQRLRSLDDIQVKLDDMRASNARMMFGVVITIISVVGSFVLGHFGPVPH